MKPLTSEEIGHLLSTMSTLSTKEQESLLADIEAVEQINALQACRDDFLTFCHKVYSGFKEGPHHRFLKPILHKVLDGQEARVTVSMPPRFGKALALDTEIPTPDRGFVRMGDLRVGDMVFAGDGSPTKVVAVSPVWKNRPVYQVETNDGYRVLADAAHEWDVVVDRKRPKWKTVDTTYVHHKTTQTKEARTLRIPLQGAAQYRTQELPIHPYVLGVWLGDGRTNGAALCTADDFIFDKVNVLEPGNFTEYATKGITRHWRPGPLGYRGSKVCFKARLDEISVTNNKHIPEIYLLGSVEQRMALLNGLIDTDGSVSKKGCVEFYNTNERLVYQVQELVQSLGTKAQVNSGPAMCGGKQFGTCWKVNFFMAGAASLPRKAERTRAADRTPERYIRATPAGVADTVCIEVAHLSHLFLCTRGYIPTHNSETIAYLYVAWYLGHNPAHHIIMVTHTSDLSSTYGRKIRDLIDSPLYAEIFPDTVVSKDKSAAGNWLTTLGGKYLAVGIGANVAGHGAHLLIADDLVSENAMLANPDAAFDTAWTYMQIGPLQRLMPNGRIVMIGTRWGKRDPIGRALGWAKDNPSSPQWLEVRFPAILPSGKSLWPGQWPVEQLLAKKASMQAQYWSAQYQQEPTSEEGALIKREWWKIWTKEDPPKIDFIISAWDTAHEAKTSADFSACTTWGVWQTAEGESRIILLDAVKGRWEFPELKKKVLELWKQWEPDTLIVEKKAAGAPLIQELRRMNIVVQETTPSRGTMQVSNDKRARMNSIADIFSSGMVYAPDKRWAYEVIDEVAEFPFGEHDDYCDCTQISLARFRNGGFLRLPSDFEDENMVKTRRKANYGVG